MTNYQPDSFLKKLTEGTLTQQDREDFLFWLNTASPELLETVLQKHRRYFEYAEEDDSPDLRFLTQRIEQAIDETDTGSKPRRMVWKSKLGSIMRAAAIIIVTIGISVLIYRQIRAPKQQNLISKTVIHPGGNKAILSLGNGTKIALDSANNGKIAGTQNITIFKRQNGSVIYQAGKDSTLKASVEYNTLTTPRGGQYQVILADGTKVWLNAASSIRFPTDFAGRDRIVELSGEAYFEVAKQLKNGQHVPFLVKTNHQVIEVMGTHFNVMAYDDESLTKTTLLEGSVKVAAGGIEYLIKPGETAQLNNVSSAINITKVDGEEAVAWKNGVFMFSNESLQASMRKIARWYGVTIIYKGDFTNIALWGSVSRFKDLSEILKKLEDTGVVHFKIQGREVIVMP